MRKKFFAFIVIASAVLGITANADILGTQTGGWSTYMGADTYFHNVQFTSDSVGNQNEYYVEYTPNSSAVPVVINGASIWGTRTIQQAEQYMKDNGLRMLAGINADYFSFKTGIPMGHTIIDGEIVSKEDTGQDGIGFRSDGTGFIRWLDIKTTLSDGESTISVKYINKWLQAGFDPVYLLTDKFGDSTKTDSECIFVICTPQEGRLHIGETMTVTVDDVFIYNGAIEIPDGKMVFTMDTSGISEYYDFLSKLRAGQTLTIENYADGDSEGIWSEAENAVSSVGGRLISGGVVNSDFEAGAAPRTAVGIKENGNIIFYTLDGRQSGYSYGAQLKTLAKRMAELGCVDAVNLDGGGSTTISALFQGTDSSTVVNSPSDGYLRSVANFIFLKDNRERTNIPSIVDIEDAGNTNYLSGMTTKIVINSIYDTANYKMEEPYNIDFSVDTATDSVIDSDGYLYMRGTGNVNVILSKGEYTDTLLYNVYETPDEIKIFNQADWNEITEINTDANEELQLSLSAASYVNGIEINSNNGLYKWEVEGDIGTITQEGIFTLSKEAEKDGKIIVSAGDCVKEIPVHVSGYPGTPNPFYDTQTHWARDIISQMAYEGLINGLEIDGNKVFRPDNNMTRAEFASMIVNYMGIDTTQYDNMPLNFSDADDIPLWAQNIVKAVSDEGLISGRTNADGSVSFAANDDITRAEAMTILGRLLPESDDYTVDLPFADSDDIPEWAEEGMQKLYSEDIISGYEDGTILPQNNMKRAEAAVMLYKMKSVL